MFQDDPNAPSEIDFSRVQTYASGARLIFANAEDLYNEAQILGEHGSFARAAVLHQISMEECAKVDMLGAAATSMLMGHVVDEKRIAKAFRDHEAKNHTNAYYATTTEKERAARASGDWKASSEAFDKFQKDFHVEVNAVKNGGLYVDFNNARFTAPKDAIGETIAVTFMRLNADFLRRSENFVLLLDRMASDPATYSGVAKRAMVRLLSHVPSDPDAVNSVFLEETFADYVNSIPATRTPGDS